MARRRTRRSIRAGHAARRKAAKSCGAGKIKVRGYSYKRKGRSKLVRVHPPIVAAASR